MKMFFLTLLLFFSVFIIIQLRAFIPLLLAISIFYIFYKLGIFSVPDLIGIFAAFVAFLAFVVYLENAKRKREEKKRLEDQMQRLANFSHYIPKDDHPEFYEKNNNAFDKDK